MESRSGSHSRERTPARAEQLIRVERFSLNDAQNLHCRFTQSETSCHGRMDNLGIPGNRYLEDSPNKPCRCNADPEKTGLKVLKNAEADMFLDPTVQSREVIVSDIPSEESESIFRDKTNTKINTTRCKFPLEQICPLVPQNELRSSTLGTAHIKTVNEGNTNSFSVSETVSFEQQTLFNDSLPFYNLRNDDSSFDSRKRDTIKMSGEDESLMEDVHDCVVNRECRMSRVYLVNSNDTTADRGMEWSFDGLAKEQADEITIPPSTLSVINDNASPQTSSGDVQNQFCKPDNVKDNTSPLMSRGMASSGNVNSQFSKSTSQQFYVSQPTSETKQAEPDQEEDLQLTSFSFDKKQQGQRGIDSLSCTEKSHNLVLDPLLNGPCRGEQLLLSTSQREDKSSHITELSQIEEIAEQAASSPGVINPCSTPRHSGNKFRNKMQSPHQPEISSSVPEELICTKTCSQAHISAAQAELMNYDDSEVSADLAWEVGVTPPTVGQGWRDWLEHAPTPLSSSDQVLPQGWTQWPDETDQYSDCCDTWPESYDRNYWSTKAHNLNTNEQWTEGYFPLANYKPWSNGDERWVEWESQEMPPDFILPSPESEEPLDESQLSSGQVSQDVWIPQGSCHDVKTWSLYEGERSPDCGLQEPSTPEVELTNPDREASGGLVSSDRTQSSQGIQRTGQGLLHRMTSLLSWSRVKTQESTCIIPKVRRLDEVQSLTTPMDDTRSQVTEAYGKTSHDGVSLEFPDDLTDNILQSPVSADIHSEDGENCRECAKETENPVQADKRTELQSLKSDLVCSDVSPASDNEGIMAEACKHSAAVEKPDQPVVEVFKEETGRTSSAMEASVNFLRSGLHFVTKSFLHESLALRAGSSRGNTFLDDKSSLTDNITKPVVEYRSTWTQTVFEQDVSAVTSAPEIKADSKQFPVKNQISDIDKQQIDNACRKFDCLASLPCPGVSRSIVQVSTGPQQETSDQVPSQRMSTHPETLVIPHDIGERGECAHYITSQTPDQLQTQEIFGSKSQLSEPSRIRSYNTNDHGGNRKTENTSKATQTSEVYVFDENSATSRSSHYQFTQIQQNQSTSLHKESYNGYQDDIHFIAPRVPTAYVGNKWRNKNLTSEISKEEKAEVEVCTNTVYKELEDRVVPCVHLTELQIADSVCQAARESYSIAAVYRREPTNICSNLTGRKSVPLHTVNIFQSGKDQLAAETTSAHSLSLGDQEVPRSNEDPPALWTSGRSWLCTCPLHRNEQLRSDAPNIPHLQMSHRSPEIAFNFLDNNRSVTQCHVDLPDQHVILNSNQDILGIDEYLDMEGLHHYHMGHLSTMHLQPHLRDSSIHKKNRGRKFSNLCFKSLSTDHGKIHASDVSDHRASMDAANSLSGSLRSLQVDEDMNSAAYADICSASQINKAPSPSGLCSPQTFWHGNTLGTWNKIYPLKSKMRPESKPQDTDCQTPDHNQRVFWHRGCDGIEMPERIGDVHLSKSRNSSSPSSFYDSSDSSLPASPSFSKRLKLNHRTEAANVASCSRADLLVKSSRQSYNDSGWRTNFGVRNYQEKLPSGHVLHFQDNTTQTSPDITYSGKVKQTEITNWQTSDMRPPSDGLYSVFAGGEIKSGILVQGIKRKLFSSEKHFKTNSSDVKSNSDQLQNPEKKRDEWISHAVPDGEQQHSPYGHSDFIKSLKESDGHCNESGREDQMLEQWQPTESLLKQEILLPQPAGSSDQSENSSTLPTPESWTTAYSHTVERMSSMSQLPIPSYFGDLDSEVLSQSSTQLPVVHHSASNPTISSSTESHPGVLLSLSETGLNVIESQMEEGTNHQKLFVEIQSKTVSDDIASFPKFKKMCIAVQKTKNEAAVCGTLGTDASELTFWGVPCVTLTENTILEKGANMENVIWTRESARDGNSVVTETDQTKQVNFSSVKHGDEQKSGSFRNQTSCELTVQPTLCNQKTAGHSQPKDLKGLGQVNHCKFSVAGRSSSSSLHRRDLKRRFTWSEAMNRHARDVKQNKNSSRLSEKTSSECSSNWPDSDHQEIQCLEKAAFKLITSMSDFRLQETLRLSSDNIPDKSHQETLLNEILKSPIQAIAHPCKTQGYDRSLPERIQPYSSPPTSLVQVATEVPSGSKSVVRRRRRKLRQRASEPPLANTTSPRMGETVQACCSLGPVVNAFFDSQQCNSSLSAADWKLMVDKANQPRPSGNRIPRPSSLNSSTEEEAMIELGPPCANSSFADDIDSCSSYLLTSSGVKTDASGTTAMLPGQLGFYDMGSDVDGHENFHFAAVESSVDGVTQAADCDVGSDVDGNINLVCLGSDVDGRESGSGTVAVSRRLSLNEILRELCQADRPSQLALDITPRGARDVVLASAPIETFLIGSPWIVKLGQSSHQVNRADEEDLLTHSAPSSLPQSARDSQSGDVSVAEDWRRHSLPLHQEHVQRHLLRTFPTHGDMSLLEAAVTWAIETTLNHALERDGRGDNSSLLARLADLTNVFE